MKSIPLALALAIGVFAQCSRMICVSCVGLNWIDASNTGATGILPVAEVEIATFMNTPPTGKMPVGPVVGPRRARCPSAQRNDALHPGAFH